MTVTDLINRLTDINQELGCTGTKIAAHNILSDVSFYDEHGDELELTEIGVSQMFGCGCWDGVVFRLRKS